MDVANKLVAPAFLGAARNELLKRAVDPEGILQGDGKLNRFVRLKSAATLSEPGVDALMSAAVAQSKVQFPASGRGPTIIKSISAKQRPRRRA